jgi:hypothetical protein
MATQPLRAVLAQPPPFDMDLVDADRVVGWIAGNAIGFRGFTDETEAIHAAWVAHRTLARRLARTHGMRLGPIDIEPLALDRGDDGEADIILASDRPIARLARPGSHSRAGDSFGFELTVPSRMSEFELRGLAYFIYRTLRKSGVRWAIWRHDRPAHAAPEPVVAGPVTARAREPVQTSRGPASARARRLFRGFGIGYA